MNPRFVEAFYRVVSQKVQQRPAHRRVPLGLSLVLQGRRLFPRLFPILKEREPQLAGTMSGGEQQRLAIGGGLMAKPRLLMLDEPSWGIAPKFGAKVLDVIQRVNETGVTILLGEQNLHKALSIAHHGYVIQTGRIVMQGSGSGLAANDDVKKTCLGL